MLFLLRKIRRKLMQKNKFTTYLLYAIGEIVLVVVGILIAVSINDWNQGRKDAVLQEKILQSLRDDLRYNLIEIQRVMFEDSVQTVKNRLLLSLMFDPQSKYNDSLQTYFGEISRYDVFSPRRMAYEALKVKGLEIIESEPLRSEIIKLYDEKYPLNALMLDLRKDLHINSVNLYNKRFLTMEKVNNKIPIDFEQLKKDQEFINSLSYIAAEGSNFVRHLNSMRTQTKIVMDKISQELLRLSE